MLAENYTVSQPYACENLTIFLIHGEEKLPEVSLLTLQEALEQKTLIVHETREVNELAVENLSFIRAGRCLAQRLRNVLAQVADC